MIAPTILTDGTGRPIERPSAPPPSASIEEKIVYVHAWHAYTDAVTDCANRAFHKGFKHDAAQF